MNALADHIEKLKQSPTIENYTQMMNSAEFSHYMAVLQDITLQHDDFSEFCDIKKLGHLDNAISKPFQMMLKYKLFTANLGKLTDDPGQKTQLSNIHKDLKNNADDTNHIKQFLDNDTQATKQQILRILVKKSIPDMTSAKKIWRL